MRKKIWRPSLHPAVIVLETDDVIFFEVLTELHFDHFERDDAGISQAVHCPTVDKRALALAATGSPR